MPRPEKVIPELCRNFVLSSIKKTYTKKDVILYALGLGVSSDPLDTDDLKFTYENADDFAALPSYAVVIPPFEDVFDGLLACPGMPEFNPMMLLHGEEKISLNVAQMPVEATVECASRISDVLDKGKGALVRISCEIFELDASMNKRLSDSPICLVDLSVFIRGIGGFGGSRSPKPSSPSKATTVPDLTIRRRTVPSQAILYRLSGDSNPLHIDPNLASMGGFDRPILHGLCTYGIATHTLVKSICGNDASCFKSIEARFSSPVIPGDELAVHIWIAGESEVRFNVEDLRTHSICVADGRAIFTKPVIFPKVTNQSLL